MAGNLPKLIKASVSFIEPTVLPDLLTRYDDLKPEYSFLASATDYSRYYKDYESQSCEANVPHPDTRAPGKNMVPLKKSHTMHSYWKSFRRSAEIAKSEGRDFTGLFYLLPLKREIPIKPLGVNKEHYAAKAYAYLFPFGCCVTNLDVNITDMPFDEFISFISNLKKASISGSEPGSGNPRDMGSFPSFAYTISNRLNAELFKNPALLERFPAHTFVFIEKTESELSDSSRNHMAAVVAVLKGQTLEDVSGMSQAKVDECLRNQLTNLRLLELLFFTPSCSFFYGSPYWEVHVPKDLGDRENDVKTKKISRKMGCMRSNYQSCLNVLFAVNRVLSHSVFENNRVPPLKLDELKRSIGVAFPQDTTKIYFSHVFKKIAPVLNLENRLNKIR